jgi:hypothetical protein
MMPDIVLGPPMVDPEDMYEIKPVWLYGSEEENLNRYQTKFGYPRRSTLLYETVARGSHVLSLGRALLNTIDRETWRSP